MKPQDQARCAETKARIAEGRFVAGLVVQLEHLRTEADAIMAKYELRFEPADRNAPELPLAEHFAACADAVEVLLQPIEEGIDLDPDEAVKQLELAAARQIYQTLGNFVFELADPSPVDAERLAKIMLLGMDAGSCGLFLARIGSLEDECYTAALAQEMVATRQEQSASAKATNKKQTAWYLSAFVTHAAYLHLNPGNHKAARYEAAAVVKSEANLKATAGKLKNIEGALARAIPRHSGTYNEIAEAVKLVADGQGDSVAEPLRQSIAALLEGFAKRGK